ncbi:MAG: hypothetical protein ABIP75_05650 [Pyrinomonadaceae bacterium]
METKLVRLGLGQLLLVAGILLTSVAPVPAAAQEITGPFRITGIQAKLYYDGAATFSRDVLAAPEFSFWNTIIGEGDAEGPSNSTLVLVEVSGTDATMATPTRRIELIAVAGRRVLLRRAVDIGLFAKGKYYAAFWLYDTGCQPVKLTARILGQPRRSILVKNIPFKCGE